MAARRTLAAGSARDAQPRIGFSMGPGRSHDPAAALKVGAAWRDLSGRPRAAERQPSRVAIIAGGPRRAGVPGLSKFCVLHRVEQLADLFDHRRLSRQPHRRQPAELRELQQLLVRAGYNVGKVDGVMGQLSRSAVKAMQIKYGLPADSWPTAELLARMRGGPRVQALPVGADAAR